MTATSSGANKETNKATSVASVVNAGSAGWASSSGSAGGSARKRVSAKEAAATGGPGVQHEARAETGLGVRNVRCVPEQDSGRQVARGARDKAARANPVSTVPSAVVQQP